MSKIIGMVVVFCAVAVMLYMSIGMFASVPKPEAGTQAHQIFSSLADIVNLSYNAFWGVLMLLVLIIFIMVALSLKK